MSVEVDDIPDDIWETAKLVLQTIVEKHVTIDGDSEVTIYGVPVIARAILEERESCAEMAELVGIPMAANGQPILMIPVQIAYRIRNR